jgi:hypothetical protein
LEWFKGRFTGTAKKWWGTPWFPIDFPWISRHWWPFCAPQTTSSGRFTQLPLAPHGADQRCLTPVVSTILSHVMLVAFADSILTVNIHGMICGGCNISRCWFPFSSNIHQ